MIKDLFVDAVSFEREREREKKKSVVDTTTFEIKSSDLQGRAAEECSRSVSVHWNGVDAQSIY